MISEGHATWFICINTINVSANISAKRHDPHKYELYKLYLYTHTQDEMVMAACNNTNMHRLTHTFKQMKGICQFV